jgi:2-hydroxychromene-2-carboxylate isomerase
MPDYILYSDFTSAECFALSELTASLGKSGAVTWKGVQQSPGLPMPARALDRRAINVLEDELADLERRVPGLIVRLPRGKPNTSRAIIAVISVMRQHPVRAAAYRDALYRAYWRDGTDLSEMAQLQRVADECGVPRFVELDHPDAEEVADEWDLDWATERLGGVPRVIRKDGKILWGVRSAAEVEIFFAGK